MCQPKFLSFHGVKFASGAAGHLPLSDYWSICVPGMLVLKRKASEGIPVVFQSLDRVQLFATPWTAACQASLSFTISRSLLKFTSIELMMSSNHLRQPEFPVVTRESRRNSRKTMWLPCHRKMKPFPATAPHAEAPILWPPDVKN